jgi:guanine nucleotide-binding protein subunit alpha
VNRLEDSIYLWKEVCRNPLLARANIILFFNKMDILKKTLESGIMVQTYVPSYGRIPNDVENVTKYFKEKFRAYHVGCVFLDIKSHRDMFIETIVSATTDVLLS